MRQALRLVGARWAAASAGGALAGLIAGLLSGILMTSLQGLGWPPTSLLLGLGLVGAITAGVGAAVPGDCLLGRHSRALGKGVAIIGHAHSPRQAPVASLLYAFPGVDMPEEMSVKLG